MSLTLDGTASAAIASTARGVAWLIELQFTSGTLRYTTAPVDISALTYTWIGGKAVDVGNLSESEDTSAESLVFGFVVDASVLSLALGNVESYRGKPAGLWLQLFDDKFQPAGAPIKRWAGYMNKVNVKRESNPDGPSTGRIELECTRAGMARSRNVEGLRLSHAQQLAKFAGDNGLQYVQTLVEQPTLWLSKKFQEI